MQDLSKHILKFPLTWHGRIITYADQAVELELNALLQRLGFTEKVSSGKLSSSGTYRAFGIGLCFESRAIMEHTTNALAELVGVKMVL